jgi:hypothetical protein
MADPNDRTFQTNTAQANRARMQGLGEGQREMDAGRDPSRYQTATNPEQRSFDGDATAPTNADRPSQADFGEEAREGAGAQAEAPEGERRDGWGLDPNLGRDEAGLGDVGGDLGAGTPANVDMHKLGQEDRPQEDWGEPADEGTTFSSNHTRRGERLDAERGQGAKTRAANKDIVSRRS